MTSETVFLVVVVLWFFGLAVFVFGVPGFLPFVYRVLRQKAPSVKDYKMAGIVGYVGLVSGCVALFQLVTLWAR